MTVLQNKDRIQTTHVGSLWRPKDLLDMMKAREIGVGFDPAAFEARTKTAVAESVQQQVAAGLDIISDGEQSKVGFFSYVRERLGGLEARPEKKYKLWPLETNAYPEYYEGYLKQAMMGNTVAKLVPLVCVAPITYANESTLKRDIANLKAATQGLDVKGVFMPSIAPSGVGFNEYYKTEEEYFHAAGAAMRTEYKAILDAGFLLQIDDPFLTDIYANPDLDAAGMDRRAAMYVESINASIKGLPEERIRFHTCYGINEGPRVFDAGIDKYIQHMLRINVGGYSFEAANVRHEHEYHIWEKVKLAPGKVLIPGMLNHSSNIVEHPELIAERLIRFADRVGRENVIASADCGFCSQAAYHPEVHPTVVWTKFKALREGAEIASKKLWK